MIDGPFQFSRRTLIAGLGATLLRPTKGSAQPSVASPLSLLSLTLRAGPTTIALRPGQPQTGIWGLQADRADSPAFSPGDEIAVTFRNELPAPAVLNWHGLDGNSTAEPLTARPPVEPGGSDTFSVALKHAGTLMCDARLLGDGQPRPSAAWAMVVREAEPVPVDRDQMMLIEDWRLSANGVAVPPGADAGTTAPVYSVNGKAASDITLRPNERIRLRFINGCQRNVIALKIDNHEARVMAIDGQPAGPFLARNGQIVLAPGSRVDVFVDVIAAPGSTSSITLHDGAKPQPIARLLTTTETPLRNAPLAPPPPLPSNGLPAQLDLKNALRTELSLDRSPGKQPDWIAPAGFSAAQPPAFRVKRNRTVVTALVNRATVPVTFHLHGHPFRLLDRLDDGWKPFWLDTLVIDAQQTQRIAFLADSTGRWLMETMAADWAAPRLIQTYEVT